MQPMQDPEQDPYVPRVDPYQEAPIPEMVEIGPAAAL